MLYFWGGGGHLAAMAAANMDGSGGLVLGLGNGGKQDILSNKMSKYIESIIGVPFG